MRAFLALLLVAAVVCSASPQNRQRNRQRSPRRQIPKTNVKELTERLANKEKAVSFVDCLISTKKNPCDNDPRGRAMRIFAPAIIRARGDCDNLPKAYECTDQDRKNIRFTTDVLSNRYPDQFLRLQRYLINNS